MLAHLGYSVRFTSVKPLVTCTKLSASVAKYSQCSISLSGPLLEFSYIFYCLFFSLVILVCKCVYVCMCLCICVCMRVCVRSLTPLQQKHYDYCMAWLEGMTTCCLKKSGVFSRVLKTCVLP